MGSFIWTNKLRDKVVSYLWDKRFIPSLITTQPEEESILNTGGFYMATFLSAWSLTWQPKRRPPKLVNTSVRCAKALRKPRKHWTLQVVKLSILSGLILISSFQDSTFLYPQSHLKGVLINTSPFWLPIIFSISPCPTELSTFIYHILKVFIKWH